MNGIMDGNQLTVFKKDEITEILIQKTDSIIDKCYRDCHDNFFRTFNYKCINFIEFQSIGNNEVIISSISDKTRVCMS